MHMSHSYPRLVGLNWDDNPERHDHKCFIIKKGRKNPQTKAKWKITVKDRWLQYHRKNQTLGRGTRRHWTHLKSVRAVVKQTDREHKASGCGRGRLVQVSQAWCVCAHVMVWTVTITHTVRVVGGFGWVPALGRGKSLKRRINEPVNRHRMVVWKRSMIYEMRGLALTSFILSELKFSPHLMFSFMLCPSFLMHLFHTCSQGHRFQK